MKLALITRRYPPLLGGAEKVLSYLAPALADEGGTVTVLTSHLDPNTPAREAIPTRRGSCAIVRLPTTRLRFLGTLLHMRGLRRWLERNPVDLAYVSMLKHDAYVAVGVGRARGFPVVLRPEGAGATGDLAWQSWGRFGRRIGARCRQADAVVAIAPAIRRELLEAGYDAARVVDLPNGVPIPGEPWSPRPGWQAAPRGVFVGRLAPEKEIGTLIRAWPGVREAWPSARLRIIGEGPERPALEGMIRERGLSEAVELPGSTADPTAELRAADLFLLPSREEGMSIALLEAMALGMPVIASAIPGNRSLIGDDETRGRLVPPGEERAWAAAIRACWEEHERAVASGRAARAAVERDYSISTVARRHLDLFERLVRARRPAAGPPDPISLGGD